jgi:hypothetical protein
MQSLGRESRAEQNSQRWTGKLHDPSFSIAQNLSVAPFDNLSSEVSRVPPVWSCELTNTVSYLATSASYRQDRGFGLDTRASRLSDDWRGRLTLKCESCTKCLRCAAWATFVLLSPPHSVHPHTPDLVRMQGAALACTRALDMDPYLLGSCGHDV